MMAKEIEDIILGMIEKKSTIIKGYIETNGKAYIYEVSVEQKESD